MVQMTYDMKNQFIDNSSCVNVFIAAFTTSHARLMLYDVLDKLGDQVLGYDTDSAWYISRPGGASVECGDMLGELTDELGGDKIVGWCGSGPKSYSYLTEKGKITCKIKGFSLTHENSQYLNMQVMWEVIEKQKDRITLVNEQKITRDPKTKELITKKKISDLFTIKER